MSQDIKQKKELQKPTYIPMSGQSRKVIKKYLRENLRKTEREQKGK